MPIVGNPIIVGTQKSGGGDDPFALGNYIESDGTQYIDTGYTPLDTSRFEMVVNYGTSQPIWACLFAARKAGNESITVWAGIRRDGNANFVYDWGNGGNGTSFGTSSSFAGMKVVVKLFKNCLYIERENGECVSNVFSSGSISGVPSLYLLNMKHGDTEEGSVTRCNAKFYRFRIWEGSSLVHEFIPWIDANNVVCLKDTVTGNLKYNAGTGNFVYGTDA